MKYIVTADIHICIKKDIPEEWQTSRYEQLAKILADACVIDSSDLIIAGDLFEKAKPSLEELAIAGYMFRYFESRNVKIYLIAGNHCTIDKETCTFHYLYNLLSNNVVFMQGQVRPFDLHNGHYLYFLNHYELSNNYVIPDRNFDGMDKVEAGYEFENCKRTLITHFRTTVGEYIKEEIDTRKLCDQFDLVVAGDIHAEYEEGNLVYTNQPINSQFEAEPLTSYLELILEEGKDPSYRRVKTLLPNLVKVYCDTESLTDTVFELNDYDFYLLAVTGSQKELREVKVNKPNVKLQKIPLLEDMVAEDVSEMQRVDLLPLDSQLIEYMRLLNFSEERIDQLLNVWKER